MILSPKMVREKLKIGVVEGLPAKALGHGELVEPHHPLVAVFAPDSSYAERDNVSTIVAVKTVANAEEKSDAMDDGFMEKLLARGPGMIKKSDLEWKQRLQALEQVLEEAAQEGMPQKPWRVFQIKVLGELVGAFRPGLPGHPPMKVALVRLKSKPHAQPPKRRPRPYPPEKRQ